MATVEMLEKAIKDGNLAKLSGIYGRHNFARQPERFLKLLKAHAYNFSGEVYMFSSPGRIEVCGNHTDHNNGKVLAAAVTVDTLAAVTPADNGIITVNSQGYPSFSVDTREVSAPVAKEEGTSLALVKGVVAWFKEHGFKTGGFNASVVSDVAKGAGVSSSSSFELLIAEILNVFYNGGKVDKIQKAIASQYAENKYFGKPSGLMDQSAISLGDICYIDFKNLSAPEIKDFPWPFTDTEIIVVNAGGDHSDLTPNYAAIRREMEEVAAYFGKKVLREVDKARFMDAIPELKNKFSGRAILRSIHYFEENERIDRASAAIEAGDEKAFMDIINQSGESSYKLLQNCYPEGDTMQRIPLALAYAKRQKGVLASRVHGGGFAGTILNFVKASEADSFAAAMSALVGEQNIFRLDIRKSGACALEF